MNGRQFTTDEAGVTPVIGIILLISITVLLAATVGAFVMGMEDDAVQDSAPTVAMEFDYQGADSSGEDDVLRIIHDAGGELNNAQTYVVVRDATCTDTSEGPNGRYNAAADFGEPQNLAAGMSMSLESTLPTASDQPCPTSKLRLDKATVRVVWMDADGRNSHTVATWYGPDASY